MCLALYYLNQAGILLVVFNQHICGPLEIVKEDITVCAWQIMNGVIRIIFEIVLMLNTCLNMQKKMLGRHNWLGTGRHNRLGTHWYIAEEDVGPCCYDFYRVHSPPGRHNRLRTHWYILLVHTAHNVRLRGP